MRGDQSRVTLVTWAKVRVSRIHAFVPHMSNGITLQDCISHNTFEDAFWYDPSSSQTDILMSNDLVWDRCVASLAQVDPAFRGYRLTGFNLGQGMNNVIRNSVAVGNQGNYTASGFMWPE